MVVDRRLIANIDWVFLGTAVVLAIVGVAMVASASRVRGAESTTTPVVRAAAGGAATDRNSSPTRQLPPWARQAAWGGVGLVALLAVLAVDYRRLADRVPLLFLISVGVLTFLLVFGPRIAGTRRWLGFGGLGVQPSELVKLVAAIIVARALAESRKEVLGLRDILGVGLAIGALTLLIAVEPDLGTAFCLVPLFFVVSFVGGVSTRTLLALMLTLGLGGGALGWAVAKDYQKQRIISYAARQLSPDSWLGKRLGGIVSIDSRAADQRGAGYQSHQSRIAVGSGGLAGRGYGRGGQSQLGYLPARHTDFIFSVLAEELGFIGVAVVLSLYLVLFWRALETAYLARDRLGALIVAGVTTLLAFQVIYNVSMVAGLVPVKGLPLPFLSYGGSSILSSFMGIGLILNVRMRRFAN